MSAWTKYEPICERLHKRQADLCAPELEPTPPTFFDIIVQDGTSEVGLDFFQVDLGILQVPEQNAQDNNFSQKI